MDSQVVPIWLLKFLKPTREGGKDHYFDVCKEHGGMDQNGTRKFHQDYYCKDSKTGPLCGTCCEEDHGGHKVLQVQRTSRKEVVKANDILTLFDIEHIQPFSINGEIVVFLPSRPQAKPAQGSRSHCSICRRSLADQIAHFCSLSCKVKAIECHQHDFPPVPKRARLLSKKDEKKDGQKDRLREEDVKDAANTLLLIMGDHTKLLGEIAQLVSTS